MGYHSLPETRLGALPEDGKANPLDEHIPVCWYLRQSMSGVLAVDDVAQFIPGVRSQRVMNIGAAVATVRQNVSLGGRLFRQDKPESFLDHRPEWATGLLGVPLCSGQQIVMDVKRRLHDTHITHNVGYGQCRRKDERVSILGARVLVASHVRLAWLSRTAASSSQPP